MENPFSQQQASSSGGLAPAHRQCHYLLGNGATCRSWALRGHDHCHRHHRYLHALPERPIDVPLLEDEGSLTYVLSQTVQALAWGTLPTANGHAILAACRLVQNTLVTRLETAKLRCKVRRLGFPEHEIFAEQDANSALADAQVASQVPQPAAPNAELSPDAAPTCNPVKVPPPEIRFRDLKKDWDKGLLRTENAAGDMYARRYGETQEDFLASHATPFDHLAEQDREVERARALARAQQEALVKTQPEPCLPAC